MKIMEDSTFGFSSSYWTNDQLLNENSVITEEVNAKYPAFLNTPFKEIRACAGDNCFYHTFDNVLSSAKELFNKGYIRDPSVDQDGILNTYRPQTGSYAVSYQCMQSKSKLGVVLISLETKTIILY